MMERPAWSLVIFTLTVQTAVGLLLSAWLWSLAPGLGAGTGETVSLRQQAVVVAAGMLTIALAAAFVHLARPGKALFALLNLRTSWLSREVGLAGLLTAGVWGLFLWEHRGKVAGAASEPMLSVAVVVGSALIYCMARLYMLRTVPAWDRGKTPIAFFTSAVLLGGLLFGVLALAGQQVRGLSEMPAVTSLTVIALVSALASATQDLTGHRLDAGIRRKWIISRAFLLCTGTLAGLLLYPLNPPGGLLTAFLMLAAAEVCGRYLFYARYNRSGF